MAPKWLVSDKAEVKSTGQEWDDNRSWDLSQVALGEYCISNNGTGRSLGHSQCTWTLKWARACRICHALNCSKYAGQWNSTAVELPNSTWMRCNPSTLQSSPRDENTCFQRVRRARVLRFDPNITRCQAYNETRSERFIPYFYNWQ